MLILWQNTISNGLEQESLHIVNKKAHKHTHIKGREDTEESKLYKRRSYDTRVPNEKVHEKVKESVLSHS